MIPLAASPLSWGRRYISPRAFQSVALKARQYSTSRPALKPSSQAAPVDTTESAPSEEQAKANGKLNVGYFTNWGIYGSKFPPSLIPAQRLTHVLYSFANVRPTTGEVYLSDLWADQDLRYPGDSTTEPGTNLYGNLKQIFLLKKKHRQLKLLLSIGGASYSPSFHPVVASATSRAKFVDSSVKLLEDYGFDGLDIDYEFPRNSNEANGYVQLLKALRAGLDKHAQGKGLNYRYPLTIAAPCGIDNYQLLKAKEMDQYLDFWNLMAYDYSGPWSSTAQHQANVYTTNYNTAKAVTWYKSQGIAKNKLVMGIPLYGRSFLNTAGPGKPFSGVGAGSFGGGIYDYRGLPLPGAKVNYDTNAIASWSYDAGKKEFISFDDEKIAGLKAKWINDQGLGGAMYWELSGDKGADRPGIEPGPGRTYVPGGSIVQIVANAMGTLDSTQNCLDYRNSKFNNLKKGM